MRVVIDVAAREYEVDITRFSVDATLGELIQRVTGQGVSPEQPLYCDEFRCSPNDTLAQTNMVEGMIISDHPLCSPGRLEGWVLFTSGGLDAGAMHTIPAGGVLTVGRASDCDITSQSRLLSKHHFSLRQEGDGVWVTDNGSLNGTYVNGQQVDAKGLFVRNDAVITASGVAFTLRKAPHEHRAPSPGSLHNLTAFSTAPFNRPPRAGRPGKPAPAEPPERRNVSTPAKFNLAAIIGPLLMAGMMVVVLKNWTYAVFAGLSPIIALMMWAEQRIRHHHEKKIEESRYRSALEEFREQLREQADAERLRRLDSLPDPAVCARYAALPDTRLWQCRPTSDDFLTLNAGIGSVPWQPVIDERNRQSDEVQHIIDENCIPQSPVEIDLNHAGVVGVIGDRESALAVGRSLLIQACVHAGPADLACMVFCDPGREEDWHWSTWLPHTSMAGTREGDRWTSCNPERSSSLLHALREHIDAVPQPAALLVIDSDVLTEGRDSPARDLLGHGRVDVPSVMDKHTVPVSGIVIAQSVEQLPASCTVIIEATRYGEGTVRYPERNIEIHDVVLSGVSADAASITARHLAHFDDPELMGSKEEVPSLVRLPDLLGVQTLSGKEIIQLWERGSNTVSTPIGVGKDGPLLLDLVKDGPHGLVGGTTGSGKSEFLRSLIVGLAACNSPEKLNFILVDFKGGAAFKACEKLPHTIGTLSNLDPQLANRAIRALEAEMRYRQRLFAQTGPEIDNLDAYMGTHPKERLPRLLLVVDEFAMLAKEYPDVLSSLVSIAAVGRTLGVHMILATQRPAGVVNDDILANTNLRVSLRVQSAADSTSVIGVPDAASIARTQQGRAYVKLGQRDINLIQTALVTGAVETDRVETLGIRPVVFGQAPATLKRQNSKLGSRTDLDTMIEAIVKANLEAGYRAPRRVWPEPLKDIIPLRGFEKGASEESSIGGFKWPIVDFALADEPDRQRQIPAGWNMGEGNIIFAGLPNTGATAALTSLALTLCAAVSPEQLDVLTLDMGAGELQSLQHLPHSIGYAGSGIAMREKRLRLLEYLRAELDRRKAEEHRERKLLVLINGLAALKDEYQDYAGLELMEGLYRAWADGPEVGLYCAASTTRVRMIPSAISDVTTQKWIFRLSEPYDYASVGIPREEIPSAVCGRCVPVTTHLQTQIASPSISSDEAADRVQAMWHGYREKDTVTKELPESVPVSDIGCAADIASQTWLIPVGLRATDLQPAMLELYPGEHALIAGPARSGKSTLLMGLGQVLREAGCEVWAIASRRSPLVENGGIKRIAIDTDERASLLSEITTRTEPTVLLIDDAEKIDDADKSLAQLAESEQDNIHIIVSARSDDLRSMYTHWTKLIRKSRCGVILKPNPDFDGDLLGVQIPRNTAMDMGAGRGYVCVSGVAVPAQTIRPDCLGDEHDEQSPITTSPTTQEADSNAVARFADASCLDSEAIPVPSPFRSAPPMPVPLPNTATLPVPLPRQTTADHVLPPLPPTVRS